MKKLIPTISKMVMGGEPPKKSNNNKLVNLLSNGIILPSPNKNDRDYEMKKGFSDIYNTMMPLVNPLGGKGLSTVASGASKVLPAISKYLTTKTPLKNSYKLNPLANKKIPLNTLYHNTDNLAFEFKDVDLLRTAKSQLKKRHKNVTELEKPSGFYTTDNPNSVFMGGSQSYAMDVPANAKVYDMKLLGRTTDRIAKSELIDLQKQGYDIIKGKNMLGLDEFIPLNKDKLLNFRNTGKRVTDQSQTFAKGFYKTETPHWIKGYKPINK